MPSAIGSAESNPAVAVSKVVATPAQRVLNAAAAAAAAAEAEYVLKKAENRILLCTQGRLTARRSDTIRSARGQPEDKP